MDKILQSLVSPDALINWLIMFFFVAYFFYKEWPEFKRRMTSGAVKEVVDETKDKTLLKRLEAIEEGQKDVIDKLDRDYRRINRIEDELTKNRKSQAEDKEEMMLIMQALLAALNGLQQLNCNGPVTEQSDRLTKYLTKKAHEYEPVWDKKEE